MAGTSIHMKPVMSNRISGLLNPQRYIQAIETQMDMAAEDVRIDMQVTSQTWNHHPVFVIEKQKLRRRVWTGDPPYFFVSHGTSVRRALMTPGFRPKTRTGWIGSNKGKGGVAFISKKLNLPGIKARNFDKTIKAKWDKQLPKLLQRAISVEAHRP